MTTHIQITNVNDGGGHDVVVNVVETESPRDEGKTVERHDLKPGESVTVRVWGWQRYVTILETAPPDKPARPRRDPTEAFDGGRLG